MLAPPTLTHLGERGNGSAVQPRIVGPGKHECPAESQDVEDIRKQAYSNEEFMAGMKYIQCTKEKSVVWFTQLTKIHTSMSWYPTHGIGIGVWHHTLHRKSFHWEN